MKTIKWPLAPQHNGFLYCLHRPGHCPPSDWFFVYCLVFIWNASGLPFGYRSTSVHLQLVLRPGSLVGFIPVFGLQFIQLQARTLFNRCQRLLAVSHVHLGIIMSRFCMTHGMEEKRPALLAPACRYPYTFGLHSAFYTFLFHGIYYAA